MPSKSLFSEPFDDGTLFKLKILKDYFKEWLPVFLSSNKPIWNKVQVFDLFAGMGKDSNGISGSPLLILEELNKWKLTIQANKLHVKVILNEYEEKYYNTLQDNIRGISDKSSYKVESYNDEFKNILIKYLGSMQESANFLFLDQNGIKQITEDVFRAISTLKQTDFIFFISSSFIKRFGDSDSFQKYLKITKQELEGQSSYHIHRIVLEYYRTLIPVGFKYYLAPFTIKKPAGIYGLIFGSNHIYGLEKFLTVCWRHDRLTGEANFDIDNEKIDLQKPSLFEQFNVPKKIQLFEMSLRVNIMRGVLATDLDVYTYTLEDGFLPKHANKVLLAMKEDSSIDFDFNLVSGKVHKIIIPSLIKRK